MALLTLHLRAGDFATFSAQVLSFDDGCSWIALDLGEVVTVHLPWTDGECLQAAHTLIDVLTAATAELKASIANRRSASRLDPTQ